MPPLVIEKQHSIHQCGAFSNGIKKCNSMKVSKYIGIIILAAIWLWLVIFIFLRAGVTLINIFWVIISGIIVFVPLYKKYFKKPER